MSEYDFSPEVMEIINEWGGIPLPPGFQDLSERTKSMLATGNVKNLDNVSPEDRERLHGIVEHYRKDPHPFRACVKDNRKRFGPGTEAVCATIKDIIEGNTFWRQGIQKGELH